MLFHLLLLHLVYDLIQSLTASKQKDKTNQKKENFGLLNPKKLYRPKEHCKELKTKGESNCLYIVRWSRRDRWYLCGWVSEIQFTQNCISIISNHNPCWQSKG